MLTFLISIVFLHHPSANSVILDGIVKISIVEPVKASFSMTCNSESVEISKNSRSHHEKAPSQIRVT